MDSPRQGWPFVTFIHRWNRPSCRYRFLIPVTAHVHRPVRFWRFQLDLEITFRYTWRTSAIVPPRSRFSCLARSLYGDNSAYLDPVAENTPGFPAECFRLHDHVRLWQHRTLAMVVNAVHYNIESIVRHLCGNDENKSQIDLANRFVKDPTTSNLRSDESIVLANAGQSVMTEETLVDAHFGVPVYVRGRDTFCQYRSARYPLSFLADIRQRIRIANVEQL